MKLSDVRPASDSDGKLHINYADAFFVPSRILWPLFEEFIIGESDETKTEEVTNGSDIY